jgi:hypothetical protein
MGITSKRIFCTVFFFLFMLRAFNEKVDEIKTDYPDTWSFEEKIEGMVFPSYESPEDLFSTMRDIQDSDLSYEATISEMNELHQAHPEAITLIIFSPIKIVPFLGSQMAVDYFTADHWECLLGDRECPILHHQEETFWSSSYRIQGPFSLLHLDEVDVFQTKAFVMALWGDFLPVLYLIVSFLHSKVS